MFSVADELTISGLDPELRAVIERHIESESGGRYLLSVEQLRREYERGYAAGVADGKRPAEEAAA